jgi:hypothetical protein
LTDVPAIAAAAQRGARRRRNGPSREATEIYDAATAKAVAGLAHAIRGGDPEPGRKAIWKPSSPPVADMAMAWIEPCCVRF